jgi:FMN phosphatase YigB (HAD superfamily)
MAMTNPHLSHFPIERIEGSTPAKTLADIFRIFMAREGFDANTAEAELAFIGDMTEDAYIAARRIGLAPIGGRAARKTIFATLQNAKNHATFA